MPLADKTSSSRRDSVRLHDHRHRECHSEPHSSGVEYHISNLSALCTSAMGPAGPSSSLVFIFHIGLRPSSLGPLLVFNTFVKLHTTVSR